MSYNDNYYSLKYPDANYTKGIFFESKSGKTIRLSVITENQNNNNTKSKKHHDVNSNIHYLDFFIEPVFNLQ